MLNVAGMVIPLAVGIVVVPVLVRELGIERFGVLSLLWVLLANLAIFDFGLGRGTTKLVAEALARGDSARIPRLVWTIAAAQAVIGLVAGATFALAAPALIDVFDVPVALRSEARTAFSLLAAAIPFMLVGTCFTAVLEATQRFDLLNAVSVPVGAATITVPLIVVFFGGSLPAVVAALVVVRALAALAVLGLSVRAFPMVGRLCAPSLAAAVGITSFAGWLTLAALSAPLLRYLDRYVLATLLSVSAVAYYSVASDLIERLWIISTAAVLTLFPAFSAFRATDAAERTHAVFVFAVKALLIAVAPVALCLVAWAPGLLRLWLGDAFAEQGATAFQLLALAAPIGVLTPLAGAALQAYGRPDVVAKLYVVSVPLNAGLVFVLVGGIGVTGAALSVTLRAAVEAALMLGIALRTIRLPVGIFVRDIWRTVLVVGGLAPVLWLAATAVDSLGMQVALAIFALGLFAIGIWTWALTGVERVQARALVSSGPR